MMLDEVDKLGRGIQGDPCLGAPGSARPGAELDLPRQLSRRAVRPARGSCSSPPRTSSTPSPARCATAWRSSTFRATPRTKNSRSPAATSSSRQLKANGLTAEQAEVTDADAARDHPRLHPRSRRASARARDRRGAAQCRDANRRGSATRRTSSTPDDSARDPGTARASRARSRCAPACRVSRPASPGPRSAATSCLSRRPASPATGWLILTGQLGEVMQRERAGGAEPRQGPGVWARGRPASCSRRATSTSMSRPARSPRTDRVPGSRCSPLSSHC